MEDLGDNFLCGHEEWVKIIRQNFDSHLRIKVMALQRFPYVCIGSHAFVMFAHENFTGAVGTLTTLYQT